MGMLCDGKVGLCLIQYTDVNDCVEVTHIVCNHYSHSLLVGQNAGSGGVYSISLLYRQFCEGHIKFISILPAN